MNLKNKTFQIHWLDGIKVLGWFLGPNNLNVVGLPLHIAKYIEIYRNYMKSKESICIKGKC